MTKQEAIEKLVETRTLTTDLLEPLRIDFESFLKLAQLPKEKAAQVQEELAQGYETKRFS